MSVSLVSFLHPEGVGSPGTAITGRCELPDMGGVLGTEFSA